MVMVPATKNVLAMYRAKGSRVKTYRKLSKVGCAGIKPLLNISEGGLNAAEIIQIKGDAVTSARTAVERNREKRPKVKGAGLAAFINNQSLFEMESTAAREREQGDGDD